MYIQGDDRTPIHTLLLFCTGFYMDLARLFTECTVSAVYV